MNEEYLLVDYHVSLSIYFWQHYVDLQHPIYNHMKYKINLKCTLIN